ncbi:uncharacterized protein sS8_3374 [Methylocaldum marinum]|uniref:Uncharacterized protein n=1 Tax=Methylocaldum marinum TaxID=1432792 RepID=A0A250KUQ1_9GAMM|nr:hypothetical protein [Methylocaldum marinum]BBA35312.1 uncharacterized protein sS8_3374 [Methylocaldum marinum]
MAAHPQQHPIVVTAGRLVSALLFNRDDDFRLALLKRVARKLGENEGYPAFIKLLATVGESADEPGKRVLAATLAVGLRRNDLPTGTLTAWGASRLWQAGSATGGQIGSQLFGSAPLRSFGPIEYLTAWFGQGTQRIRLGSEVFADSLRKLIDLVNADADARALYPRKLAADTQTELEGIYMRGTRERLATIASGWMQGLPASGIAAAAAMIESEPARAVPRGWVLRDL